VLKVGFIGVHRIKQLFRQVLLGTNHAHEVNIIHRDLSCENILFKDDKNSELKLVDFTLGVKGADFAMGIVGKPFYMAPELFTSKF